MVAAVNGVGSRNFAVKNTFIHVEDKELGRTESDAPPARSESDPTGQSYIRAGRCDNVKLSYDALHEAEEDEDADDGGVLVRTQTHVPGGLSFEKAMAMTEGEDDGEEDDDDVGVLQRTRTHVPGRDLIAHMGDEKDSWLGFRVKNTFVHVDDADEDSPLRRCGSEAPPARTVSDPTAHRRFVPRQPKRLPSVSEDASAEHSGSALYEGECGEEAGDDTGEELQTMLTYDPFSMSSPTTSIAGGSASSRPTSGANDEAEREQDEDDDAGELETAVTYDPFLAVTPSSASAALPFLPPPAFGLAPFPFVYPPTYGMTPYPCVPPPAAAQCEIGQSQVAPKPELGVGPAVGNLHRFHTEVHGFGTVSSDYRQFTKGEDYEGRLSVLTGSHVDKGGKPRYLIQFTAGELSKADGVGFVFASRLPCAKNIQKIVSVFVNQRGRICMRVFGDLIRARAHVRPLRLGDWIELAMDLDNCVATFNVWPPNPSGFGPPSPGEPDATAQFQYGRKLTQACEGAPKPVQPNVGHFACVVQNVGVTVTVGS